MVGTTSALLLAVRNGLVLLEIPFISSCSLVMLLVNMPRVSMILALSSAFIALFFSSLDIRSCRGQEREGKQVELPFVPLPTECFSNYTTTQKQYSMFMHDLQPHTELSKPSVPTGLGTPGPVPDNCHTSSVYYVSYSYSHALSKLLH